MFDLSTFDVKKFLSLQLNDGSFYKDAACGCIKGNFVAAFLPQLAETKGYDWDFWTNLRHRRVGYKYSQTIKEEFLRNSSHLRRFDEQLADILDHAEEMLWKQKPQRAKLFLIRALRKYGYIPKETEIPSMKELCNVG